MVSNENPRIPGPLDLQRNGPSVLVVDRIGVGGSGAGQASRMFAASPAVARLDAGRFEIDEKLQ